MNHRPVDPDPAGKDVSSGSRYRRLPNFGSSGTAHGMPVSMLMWHRGRSQTGRPAAGRSDHLSCQWFQAGGHELDRNRIDSIEDDELTFRLCGREAIGGLFLGSRNGFAVAVGRASRFCDVSHRQPPSQPPAIAAGRFAGGLGKRVMRVQHGANLGEQTRPASLALSPGRRITIPPPFTLMRAETRWRPRLYCLGEQPMTLLKAVLKALSDS